MLTNVFFYERLFKKCWLLLLTFSLSFAALAQKEIEKVRTYLKANTEKYHLSDTDINEMSVSSAYLSPTTGWYHVYFVQKHQSIEVYNAILNTVTVKDNVANANSTFVPDIASKVPAGITAIRLNPLQAINKVAISLNLVDTGTNTKEISANKLPNGQIEKAVYTNTDLSDDKIPVKLYWFRYDSVSNEKGLTNKEAIKLVWNVQLYTKDHKNNWSVQVDAQTGKILDTKDMVIHCDFGIPNHKHESGFSHQARPKAQQQVGIMKPLTVNSYRVFDYPIESPNHGAQTLVTNPYTRFAPTGTGPGITNGWHFDEGFDRLYTRGNNVNARQGADENGTIYFYSPYSSSLTFDYSYTHSVDNTETNLDAAITNLFYWNNMIHDILWKYGFDEPSGNFQMDNMNRGGIGGDYVLAHAQDLSDSNNSSFSVGPDGSVAGMRMYLWSTAGDPAYTPDADFDNGIITHEYGHGWSIRLTGGPSTASCLQNAEQGGEGWSDYLALMFTTNWASLSPDIASANLHRGIGTYVLGQSTNANGIRPSPYSYDMANVNANVTYGKVASYNIPHGIGSIWATMLWDMTWEIIMQDNQIVGDIYNITTLVGNVAALKLVNEGLRLQPCNPSFIDSRNAILQADKLLFNGRYTCAIWKAFARRGLGLNASTGTSSNDRIVTEDFTIGTDRLLSSPRTNTICSNTPFVYTATTEASGVTNYSWSRAVVSGINNPASSGSSASINETLVNNTSNTIVVTYIFILTPNACGDLIQQEVKVRVNPAPMPIVAIYTACKDGIVPIAEGLSVTNIPDSNVLSGTLSTNSPTYVRGKGNNATTYIPEPNSSPFYNIHTFVAAVSGTFSIETGSTTFLSGGLRYDTYLTLYEGSFDPASPATNFLKGDDDSQSAGLPWGSKITYNFTEGNTYVLVCSTPRSGITGNYTVQANTNLFKHIGWYLNSSGGNALATTDIFNPVGVPGSGVPNTATPGSYSFYLSTSERSACRTPTSFIINAATAPSPIGASRCGSGTVALTAAGCAGGTINWYAGASGGSALATGTSFSTPVISSTTTYYVSCTEGTCSSVRAAVQAIININLFIATTPTAGNYRASENITSTANVPSGVNYYAGKAITLSPGFQAGSGEVFQAKIENCP